MTTFIRNSTVEFLIFANQTGDQSIEVCYEDNEIWLIQKRIAELFEVSLPTINEHLKHIFASEELNELSVIRNFRITASDGKNYNTKHYNLDAVISVRYAKLKGWDERGIVKWFRILMKCFIILLSNLFFLI